MGRKITDHQIKQMQLLQAEGYKKSEIGRKLGISRPTVFRYLGSDSNSYQKLSEATVKKIISLRKQHKSLSEIVIATGVSMSSVQKIAYTAVKGMTITPDSYKIGPATKESKLGRPRISKETTDAILKLRRNGLYYSEIAQKLKVSPKTISNICNRNEVKAGLRKPKKVLLPPLQKPLPQAPSIIDNVSKETKLQIKSLYLDEGLTRTRIKERLKMSFSTVDKILFEMDIDAEVVKVRKMKNKPKRPVFERIRIPSLRAEIETFSAEEAKRVRLKYNI